jgi:outer membrane protein
VGLRATLDVLIAEENLSSAQLALVGARHDEYAAAADVLAAAGMLYPEDFAADTQIYDPKANLEHERHGWTRAPWAPAVGALDRLGEPAPPPVPEPLAPEQPRRDASPPGD